MSYKIKSEIEWNGLDASKFFDAAQLKALTESAILVEGRAVENTVGNVDTGRLIQSIDRDIKKETAYVGTNVEYAPYLEFGTRFHKAYPFLRPAFKESITDIKNIFKKWYRAVKYVD